MTRGLIQKEDDTMSGTQDGRLEIDKKTQFLLHSLRFGTVGDWQGKVWKADDCQSAGMPSPHFFQSTSLLDEKSKMQRLFSCSQLTWHPSRHQKFKRQYAERHFPDRAI